MQALNFLDRVVKSTCLHLVGIFEIIDLLDLFGKYLLELIIFLSENLHLLQSIVQTKGLSLFDVDLAFLGVDDLIEFDLLFGFVVKLVSLLLNSP